MSAKSTDSWSHIQTAIFWPSHDFVSPASWWQWTWTSTASKTYSLALVLGVLGNAQPHSTTNTTSTTTLEAELKIGCSCQSPSNHQEIHWRNSGWLCIYVAVKSRGNVRFTLFGWPLLRVVYISPPRTYWLCFSCIYLSRFHCSLLALWTIHFFCWHRVVHLGVVFTEDTRINQLLFPDHTCAFVQQKWGISIPLLWSSSLSSPPVLLLFSDLQRMFFSLDTLRQLFPRCQISKGNICGKSGCGTRLPWAATPGEDRLFYFYVNILSDTTSTIRLSFLWVSLFWMLFSSSIFRSMFRPFNIVLNERDKYQSRDLKLIKVLLTDKSTEGLQILCLSWYYPSPSSATTHEIFPPCRVYKK